MLQKKCCSYQKTTIHSEKGRCSILSNIFVICFVFCKKSWVIIYKHIKYLVDLIWIVIIFNIIKHLQMLFLLLKFINSKIETCPRIKCTELKYKKRMNLSVEAFDYLYSSLLWVCDIAVFSDRCPRRGGSEPGCLTSHACTHSRAHAPSTHTHTHTRWTTNDSHSPSDHSSLPLPAPIETFLRVLLIRYLFRHRYIFNRELLINLVLSEDL